MSADRQQTSTKPTMQGNKNAASGLLSLFDKNAKYSQDGYCMGDYPIAASVTHGFLQSEYGDDGAYKGVKAGDKTCLSASHFAAAIKELGPDTAPKVHLHATHDKALETVSYKDLKRFAAAPEATTQSGRQETHINPTSGNGAVKERNEFGGDQGTLAPGRGKSQNTTTDAKPSGSGGQRG